MNLAEVAHALTMQLVMKGSGLGDGDVLVFGEERYVRIERGELLSPVFCSNAQGRKYGFRGLKRIDSLLEKEDLLGFALVSPKVIDYMEQNGEFVLDGDIPTQYKHTSSGKTLQVF